MNRVRMLGMASGTALLAVSLVMLLASVFSSQDAAAGSSPTIGVSSAYAASGGQGTVTLQAGNMPAPGLGAWAANITYNPAILEVVSCTPQSGSVCNPNFASGTVRVTGAVANGLVGDSTLASLTFHCVVNGNSALSLSVDTLADATVGGPQDISAAVSNGTFNCGGTPPTATGVAPTAVGTASATATPAGAVAAGPRAGFGPGGGDTSIIVWLVAGLAGAGLAWLSAGLAGAGFAAVFGSDRRSGGFLPRMRPMSRHNPRSEERKASSSDYIPSFRPLKRPDDER